jgi:hypothetical protein
MTTRNQGHQGHDTVTFQRPWVTFRGLINLTIRYAAIRRCWVLDDAWFEQLDVR